MAPTRVAERSRRSRDGRLVCRGCGLRMKPCCRDPDCTVLLCVDVPNCLEMFDWLAGDWLTTATADQRQHVAGRAPWRS